MYSTVKSSDRSLELSMSRGIFNNRTGIKVILLRLLLEVIEDVSNRCPLSSFGDVMDSVVATANVIWLL